MQANSLTYRILPENFVQVDSLFYRIHPSSYLNGKVAGFDVDWTLSYNEQHLYAKEPEDTQVLPGRCEKIRQLHEDGYTIVLFTNQFAKSKKEKTRKVERIHNFAEKLDVPCWIFISTEKDDYRKPNIGMWKTFKNLYPTPITKAFFVGDALGRPQDFSDADGGFAEGAEIPSHAPEDFFPQDDLDFSRENENERNLIVFVGMPGAGKTTFFKTHLEPVGYTHINQDTLKSRAAILSAAKRAMDQGKDVVIDSTNPALEGRVEFYEMALTRDYDITVLYFVRDGTGWNALRGENKVPIIAYHMYFKKLEPPTEENTPGNIFYIA